MYENLLGDIKGAAVLQAYEVSRSFLTKKGKHIRPFDPALGFAGRPKGSNPTQLDLDAKLLMLAAAKTELARNFDFILNAEQAVGCWIRLHRLLIMDGGSLRLTPSRIFARKDASATFDSGRIGEAVGHLFMMAQGYCYWDHLPTLLEAAATGVKVSHAETTKLASIVQGAVGNYPGEQPDFVCEDANGNVAILECKGRFTRDGEAYSANASVLRGALSQLNGWSSLVVPTPSKQFVVGTFLRHDGDVQQEPSMIAWVDPPGKPPVDNSLPRLSSDAIRRGHYGALLAILGFIGEGRDLRLRARRKPTRRHVVAVAIHGQKYVINRSLAPWSLAPWSLAPWSPAPWSPDLHFHDKTTVGLRLDLFGVIARSLNVPEALLETNASRFGAIEDGSAVGFLMPDGSFVGELTERSLVSVERIEV